jgi:hypothetical protein
MPGYFEGKQMRRSQLVIAFMLLALSTIANATVFAFKTDPFEGSDALTTPGRQIVGGEAFITFDIAQDLFLLESPAFGVGDAVFFANDLVANLPSTGLNVIVLQTAPIPFNAGLAANAIADQITSPGPGFFIYFNSGLDLPRLVFSTDLSDNTADLKVLFRMTNLSGDAGRAALPTFTASNFAFVPEPSTLMLLATAGVLWVGSITRRRRRASN